MIGSSPKRSRVPGMGKRSSRSQASSRARSGTSRPFAGGRISMVGCRERLATAQLRAARRNCNSFVYSGKHREHLYCGALGGPGSMCKPRQETREGSLAVLYVFTPRFPITLHESLLSLADSAVRHGNLHASRNFPGMERFTPSLARSW